jgi:hypothetical protein
MRRSVLSCLVVALLAAGLTLPACGEESNWKMPNLNPFASKGKSASTSNAPTSGWKMPKMWPSGSGNAAARAKPRQSNQPSTISKMTNGTKEFFSKTADTLTPWDNDKPKAPAGKVSGSNSFWSQSTSKTKKASDGVAPASWWSGEKKNEQPKTVGDFLSQPRP